MDDLSPLFHDIEFNERFRGYDVEEVDAYVDRVAKAAALVQGRIAELQERVASAEAQPRAAAPAPSSTGDFDDARVTRVLVLAQRTADAAIEEAKAEAEAMRLEASTDAERLRREADDHASLVLAEAETDRRRMITEAEETAAGAVAAERARVAAEVAELERHRAFLSDDIAILEQHLAETRLSVAASISALTDLIEAPEAFRAPAMPATSGVEVPAGLVEGRTAPAEPEVEFEPEAADPAADATSPESPIDWAVVEPAPEPVEAAIPEPAIEDEPTVAMEAIELEEPSQVDELADPVVDEPEPAAMVDETDHVTPPSVPTIDEPDWSVAAELSEPPVVDEDPAVAAEASIDLSAPFEPEVEPAPAEEPVEPTPDPTEAPLAPAAASATETEPEPPVAEPAVVEEPSLVFDVDLVEAEAAAAEPEPVVDLTEPAIDLEQPAAPDPAMPVDGGPAEPDADAATTVAPPRLVTAEDIEATSAGEWIDELRDAAAAEPKTEELLFAPADAPDNDHFLDQLRDAVAADEPEEFGEDALAAFFDDGDDGNDRGWFNRRR